MTRPNSPQAWLLATRPKTLTGAFIPVVLAAALAHHDGCLQWGVAVLCLLFAGGMQIAANLINDLYDYLRGTDRADRLGPERACAQGWITPQAMRVGIGVSIAAACVCGLGVVALAWQQLPWHGAELVALGLVCIVFAYLYTRFCSYYGLGDVLVLLFFGYVPVCGTYYVMSQGTITPDAWLLGTISGLAIDALLIVNNYRDCEQDRLSGKRTIVVLLGRRFGHLLYLGVGIAAVALSGWLIQRLYPHAHSVPVLSALIGAYLVLHIQAWQLMGLRQGRQLNAILGITSRNMTIFAIALALTIL